MSEAKRYDIELNDNRCDCGNSRGVEEVEYAKGDYVRYVDHQSELTALREELAKEKQLSVTNVLLDVVPGKDGDGYDVFATSVAHVCEKLGELFLENETLRERLTAAEQWNAKLQKQLDSIDNHLRGNVNDPDPLPPIMPGAASYTTTYGLVAGLRRERDYLKNSATPLPAGDDYLRQLAQRLREYVGNPHHINPVSEAFKRLIDDSAFALSKAATALAQPTESGASE